MNPFHVSLLGRMGLRSPVIPWSGASPTSRTSLRSRANPRSLWSGIVMAATLAACGSNSPTVVGGGGPVATMRVTIRNNSYDPRSILVTPGATVTWTWVGGGAPHDVTFDAVPQLSSRTTAEPGFEHEATMPAATGTYDYQCTIHPSEMNGSVIVQ